MNILQLMEKLEKNNINPNSYSFEDDYLKDCYYMLKDNIGWEVFYRDRGEKIEIHWFELESQACEYLANLVLTDLV